MPYIDDHLVMSDKQAVTASAASTNVIDLGAAGIGDGRGLRLLLNVDEAATASGAATVGFTLQTAVDAVFSTPVQLTVAPAIPKADIVKGATLLEFTIPPSVLRYVRMYYTVATGPLTAGKFTAALVMEK